MTRNQEIATTILQQLGGAGRLRMMTGAYNFVAIENGVSFRIKNPKANYIKVTLNGLDLYDLEVGRVRGMTYKVVSEQKNLYFDMLKPAIEKATGMYLSLFSKGGTMKTKYTVYVYYGGEMEDEVFHTNSLALAKKHAMKGEHAEIMDNESNSLVEDFADGGTTSSGKDYVFYGVTKSDNVLKIISEHKTFKAAEKKQDDYWKKGLNAGYSKTGVISKANFEKDKAFLKFAKGGGVSRGKNQKIKDWYIKNYPDDELGEQLNASATFDSLWRYVGQGYHVYEILGVSDSVVRERVFEHFAKLYKISYDEAYKKLLSTDEYAQGGAISGFNYSIGGL